MVVEKEDRPLKVVYYWARDEAGELELENRRRGKSAYLVPWPMWPADFQEEKLGIE